MSLNDRVFILFKCVEYFAEKEACHRRHNTTQLSKVESMSITCAFNNHVPEPLERQTSYLCFLVPGAIPNLTMACR
jgi:hypothetical protein